MPIVLKDYWQFLENESIQILIDFFETYSNYLDNEAKRKLEEEKEKRTWQLYVSIYPNFDQKTFMSYAKFLGKNDIDISNKNKIENKNSSGMTKNDILLLAERKRKKWREEQT